MEKVKVIGYEEFTSKKGNVLAMVHMVRNLERRDSHIECAGERAGSYFVSDTCRPMLSKADVGKEINVAFAYYNGQDNLVAIFK